MRLFVSASIVLLIVSAVAVYAVGYETRELARIVEQRERKLETLRQDIAVMRAERAYLARPDRIAPLAREMGLRPARREQFEIIAGSPASRHVVPGHVVSGHVVSGHVGPGHAAMSDGGSARGMAKPGSVQEMQPRADVRVSDQAAGGDRGRR